MRDLIDIIESKKPITESASAAEDRYAAVEAFLEEGHHLEEGQNGKKGNIVKLFLYAAAALGIGQAALNLVGGEDGYYGPIGAGIDPNDDFVARVADFGPNLFPRDPQKPGGPAPDHEDFW